MVLKVISGILLLALVGSNIYQEISKSRLEDDYISLSNTYSGILEERDGYQTTNALLSDNLSLKAIETAALRDEIKSRDETLVEFHHLEAKFDSLLFRGEAEIRYVAIHDTVEVMVPSNVQPVYSFRHTAKDITVDGKLYGATGWYDIALDIPSVILNIYVTETRRGLQAGYIEHDADFLTISEWSLRSVPRKTWRPRWIRPVLGCGYGLKDGPGFMAGAILWKRYVPMVTLETGGASVYVGYIF